MCVCVYIYLKIKREREMWTRAINLGVILCRISSALMVKGTIEQIFIIYLLWMSLN